MNRYLVDTTVLIDYLRGEENIKVIIEDRKVVMSFISEGELMQGAKSGREINAVEILCSGLKKIDITQKIAKISIALLKKYHASHGLMFLDALIAATALENKLILITDNVKEYKFIDNLEVINHKEAEVYHE